MSNPNTSAYWDNVYEESGSQFRKRKKLGERYMQSLLPLLGISRSFSGTILDFGCGMGYGTAVLKRAFPKAEITGVDHAESGLEFARKHLDPEILFLCSSWEAVPNADIIISSHVMEHLNDDKKVVKALQNKCSSLFIAVPYREDLNSPFAEPEHVRSYDETYYDDVKGFLSSHVIPAYPLTLRYRFRFAARYFWRTLTRRKNREAPKHIIFQFGGK